MAKALVLDCETNGLDKGKRHVLELSWLILEDNMKPSEPRRMDTVYFNRPNLVLNPEAIAVNGVTQEDVDGGVDPRQYYMNTLIPLINECDIIICHNCYFDINVIIEDFKRLGVSLKGVRFNRYCTLLQARKDLRAADKYYKGAAKLENVISFYYSNFDPNTIDWHTAEADTLGAARIFYKQMKMQGITSITQLVMK